MQALHNLMVPVGNPFSSYLPEIRLFVGNVRCIGHVALKDGTMQTAIKTRVVDQLAGLSALFFAGKNMRALPFDRVEELMESWEDLALNQAIETAPVRLAGGMVIWPRTYNQAFRSRQFGGVMSVEIDPFVDEYEEFGKMYAIMREKGSFGENKKCPPFYVSFNSREERDAAHRAFGPNCLNCDEGGLFARECPAKFINRSALIHPAVGDGTPDETENRWRRWRHRLCQWAQARANRNNRDT